MQKRIFCATILCTLCLGGCETDSQTPSETQTPQQQMEDEFFTTDDLLPEDREAMEEIIREEAMEEAKKQEEAEMKKIEEDYNLVVEMEELEEQKKSGKAAKGSCNVIDDGSLCLEYVGSIWTEGHMQLNCSDTGIFTTQPCPAGSLGGCNVGNGGPSDLITWFYGIGGSPLSGDELKNAKKACEANPFGRWINNQN